MTESIIMDEPICDRTALAAALAQGRLTLQRHFEADHKATRYVIGHTQLIDRILLACHAQLRTRFSMPDDQLPYCLIAVGGYGRQELFPYSDIDLLILLESHEDPAQQRLASALLQMLWDLGLKTGHAVRETQETITLARADHTVAAALLDRRFLCGNHKLFDGLNTRFEQEVRGKQIAAFIEAKTQEKKARHKRQGDSRYFLEPNLKEQKGGLRDLHHLYWIAYDAYGARHIGDMVARGLWSEQDARLFRKAQLFLWRLRVQLHLLSGREEERLSFDIQPLIAETFGYKAEAGESPNEPVERFMKHYFRVTKSVADLTRLFAAMLEEDCLHHPSIGVTRIQARLSQESDFALSGSRLTFAPHASLEREPLLMLRLFRLSQLHDVVIHPEALHQVFRHLRLIDHTMRNNPEASELFLEMLLHPKQSVETLRELNDSGILAQFIPEFGQIIGQMQYDRYHTYTVDEHTLRAIGILHSIEQGEPVEELPLACDLAGRIESRRCLFVALLCHDIAKGSGHDHALAGAQMVRTIGQRLGLSAAELDTAAWLVEHQMLLSDHALKRDASDASTTELLIARIQSPERLRLLLLLTVCDMRAVGPQVWNRWRGALLRDLYYRTEAAMGTKPMLPDAHAPNLLLQAIGPAMAAQHAALIAEMDESSWAHLAPEQIDIIAPTLIDYWQQQPPFALRHRIDGFEGVTHITLCTLAHPQLLAMIAGCMAVIDANIIRAKQIALPQQSILLLLEIQDRQSRAFDDTTRLNKLHKLLAQTLAEQSLHPLRPLIQAQQAAYKQRRTPVSQILFDNQSSHDYTLIEIEGEDTVGFLYRICAALAELKLTIATAHISTYGSRIVDVFYIRDRYGLKIEKPASLKHIRQQLLAALNAS